MLYGLSRPAVRISHITVYGDDQSLSIYATAAMRGSYFGIIPRDSTFFYPAGSIRAAILDAHPEIAAIAFFRDGFSGLSIRADLRTPVARWCGLGPTPGVTPYCYLFDTTGFVYAALPETASTTASTTAPAPSAVTLNPFVLYAPLAGGTQEPLRATIAHADSFPDIFDFARQTASFGSPVTYIKIGNDGEVDLHLASGTYLRYLLGNEQDAYAALVSARNEFNLADGSVEYVDLRFSGKVYVKKKTEVP